MLFRDSNTVRLLISIGLLLLVLVLAGVPCIGAGRRGWFGGSVTTRASGRGAIILLELEPCRCLLLLRGESLGLSHV